MISRGGFLTLTVALQAALARGTALAQSSTPSAEEEALLEVLHQRRLGRRALVLSGGGARGAYQAGIVHTWVYENGLKDGQPLPNYSIVCGTSIGALNGYMIASGRYSELNDMWLTVGRQNVVHLKSRYRYIVDSNAGVLDRIGQAIGLALGARSDVTGVLDSSRVKQWLTDNVDIASPVLMPMVWTVTNLSDQRPEFFYRIPSALTTAERETAINAIKDTVGPDTAVREATDDILIDSLLASAAIPLAFDPVVLPTADGKGTAQYVDGGVTANTPIGVARAFAAEVDVLLMDPKFEPETYKNLLDVGTGVFGTMQQRILESDIKAAFFETFGRDAMAKLPREKVEQLTSPAQYDALRDFINSLYATTFFVKRPEKTLPVEVVGFSDQEGLYAAYEVGMKDGLTPFERYRSESFEL